MKNIKRFGDINEGLRDSNRDMWERLSELRNEIYNAEDGLGGVYNSDDIKYAQYTEINERYRELIVKMNELVQLLDEVID